MAAADWWGWDFETAYSPEESGFVYGVAGNNATFKHFSDETNLVIDQRGYNTWLVGEANDTPPRASRSTPTTGASKRTTQSAPSPSVSSRMTPLTSSLHFPAGKEKPFRSFRWVPTRKYSCSSTRHFGPRIHSTSFTPTPSNAATTHCFNR
ncbi:hypothetical protein LB505_013306 [Fusarium chuoi]|nr:hypothetical protein LB505_013306 [Fusarium chuoi]